jgi:uncharacterized protein DUF3606
MADDQANRRTPSVDRARIDLNDEQAVSYWAAQFGCTEAQLMAAIDAVGVLVDNIRNYLEARASRQVRGSFPPHAASISQSIT